MKIRSLSRVPVALAISFALAQSPPVFADPPTTSAYATDTQSSHVEDATSRGIGQVNMITCIMSSMRPDATVNDGPYNALVDQTKCDSSGRASTDNANASVQSSTFMTSTVNSTRTSNTEPMRARIWLDDPESQDASIFVNMSASAAPSANNPYGIFRVDYCGKFQGAPGCGFHGFLDGTASGISYFEQEQGDGGNGTKALRMTATSTTSGSGRLHMADPNNSTTFSFAYNADYYRRSDDGGEQCFARDARDPDTGMSVWRYGLYDSVTGARIERESGFPIEFTRSGTKYQGYLGYYGLSLQSAAQELLTNGDTIERVEYSANGAEPTRTPFTVIKAGGKLTKYTRHNRTLAGIDHIKFTTFVGNEASSFFSGAQPNTQYEIYWDDTAGDFKVTAQMNCGQNGCSTQALQSEQSVAATFWEPRGGIQAWSQQLGGELFINLQGVTIPVNSGAVQVAYRSQDTVYPSQLPATLHCVRDCPTAASIAAYFGGGPASSPYVTGTANNFQPTIAGNVVGYSTDAANAMLLDALAAPVLLDVDAEELEDSQQFRNGLRSGKLFASLGDAECAPGSGTYCEWRVNALDVYYQWETGPNAHNQFAAVKNSSGAFVNLDPPLQVSFDVPQGASYGDYAGKNIVLQYGGFGDLWGVPGICVSPQTNEEVACDGGEVRYVPSFVIPYDVTSGRVTANGTTYLVKWLEREIRFARKNLAVCDGAGLTVPSGTTLPTATDLKDPSDPASDIYIGVRPVVTAAPRVIHGEVKF
jgi:hypothetical protein